MTAIDGQAGGAAATGIPAGYMSDAKGRLVPEAIVPAAAQLEDQTVRSVMGYAQDLSARIARFKGHTFDDLATFMDVLASEYGARRGGTKGNVTLTTYDGCMKVRMQVQDRITFGPELQVAKTLLDEVLSSWTEGSRPELRAVVDHAFQVDREGRINRAALFGLRRLHIDDAGWGRAMQALTDSIRTIGTATYLRFYHRAAPNDSWKAVPIDIAAVRAPAAAPAPGGGS